jgi:hypothetical protein
MGGRCRNVRVPIGMQCTLVKRRICVEQTCVWRPCTQRCRGAGQHGRNGRSGRAAEEMVEAGEQPEREAQSREQSNNGIYATLSYPGRVGSSIRLALKFIALDDPTRAKTKGFATACGLTGRRVSKEQQRGEDLHSWGSGKAEPAVVLPTLPKRHNIKTCSREGSVSPRRLGELLTSVQQGDVNGSAELGGSPPACLVTYHRR